MKLEDLKMGDMFYCREDNAWVIVVQSNRTETNTLLIIDDRYAFYLEPETDKDSINRWVDAMQKAPQFRIGAAYKKFIRDIEK